MPQDQPLGLTVHSLPALDGADGDVRRTAAGRWKMIAVLAICAAPVIASYLTYYVVRPDFRRVFGELIDPQRPLPDLRARELTGNQISLRSLKGQWLLVSVSGGACDAGCERHLYLQRQLRESLGKDKDRLDWVWLVADTAPLRQALLPALKQATVLRVDAAALARWLAPQEGHRLNEHLYLVDPMGNWMMRFPAATPTAGAAADVDTVTASKIKRDLDRLMRAAAAWDLPGRSPP